MDRIKESVIFLLAIVLAALCIPALSAQKTGSAPATKGTPLEVAAPAWQTGDYWATFDGGLLVDFADLARFRDADLRLGPPAAGENRVVFLGDSITQGWNLQEFFPGKPYVNRGISGQTSSQMLLRFRQDAIDLNPKAVVILAGTNDLAENTGPVTLKQVEGNLMSMAQLAKANGIGVVLCSVLPSVRYGWHPELKNPAPRIVALNAWIKAYATGGGYAYVDYYSAMADSAGGLPHKLSLDGVHPLAAGYALMAPLAQAGIEKTLNDEGSHPRPGTKHLKKP